jgi:hypothetical protein
MPFSRNKGNIAPAALLPALPKRAIRPHCLRSSVQTAKDVFFSGDLVKDQNNLRDFVIAYIQMNRWAEIKAGGQVLFVGADNYPFPIPPAW